MKNKAQLTVFIIIGIFLTVSIGVVVYLEQQKVTVPLEETVVLPTIAAVPVAAQPIQDYITSCIAQVGEQAVREIGLHGGYINPKQLGYNAAESSSTETSAAKYLEFVIPYWRYLKSDNECTGECVFSTERPEMYRMPGKGSIEQQLDDYVSANLEECLMDFAQFRSEGFEFVKSGKPMAQTTIAAQQIIMLVDWPITAKKDGNELKLDQYFTQLNVDLKSIYNEATDITNAEIENCFIEKHAKNLIDIFSDVDEDMLPPISDLNIGSDAPVMWMKSDVEDRLMSMLEVQVPLLHTISRDYAYITAPPNARDPRLYENFYNRGMFVPLERPYANLQTRFEYSTDWKPYFEINCDGELCEPESVFSSSLFSIGIQKYSFAYDVSFPVLVTINDPDAFNGKGYTFMFFIEANIRSNDCLKTDYAPLEFPAGPSVSDFCEPRARTPYNVTVVVTNKVTNQPISEATILFSNGDYGCPMGATDETGTLVKEFPSGCFNCILTAETDIAPATRVRLSTLYNKPVAAPVKIEVDPYRQLDFSLKKLNVSKQQIIIGSVYDETQGKTINLYSGWQWTPTYDQTKAENIVSGEHGTITLQRKTAEGEDAAQPVIVDVDPDADLSIDLSKNVSLVPGDYSVKVEFVKRMNNEIIIPPQSDYKCTMEFGNRDCTKWCVPDEKEIIESGKELPLGSAEFDWSITSSELNGAKTIIFYTPFLDLESVTDTCYVTANRHGGNYQDVEEWQIGDYPVGAVENWKCGVGGGVWRTVCERTLTDLDMLTKFKDIVDDNKAAFKPTIVSG